MIPTLSPLSQQLAGCLLTARVEKGFRGGSTGVREQRECREDSLNYSFTDWMSQWITEWMSDIQAFYLLADQLAECCSRGLAGIETKQLADCLAECVSYRMFVMHKRWLLPSLCFFVANFISVLVCLMRCASDIKTATREAVFWVKVSISAEGNICT